MSNSTKAAASRFVTAYGQGTKSSVGMVRAAVDILSAGVKPAALVALVRGAYESKNGAFETPADTKAFERLVSQRSFAGQLVLIIGEDAATDEIAIKAALSVASGQLPRAKSTAIATTLAGSNDAPAFAKAIKAAKADKGTTTPAVKSGQEPKSETASTETPSAVAPLSWKQALEFIDGALKSADEKQRPAMLKALKATVLRHSNAPVTVKA